MVGTLVAGPLVGAAVLLPVFWYNYVVVAKPTDNEVMALRRQPDTAALDAVAALPPLGPKLPDSATALREASGWLNSVGSPADVAPIKLTTDDLTRGEPLASLAFSSLHHVDLLVTAFRASGRAEYLTAARNHLLAYVRYERQAWTNQGFLWNDHAIAARVGVIVRFWAAYRDDSAFSAADAAEILQHLRRSVALLADAAHFTAWSNHGVMQNIALLQAAAAFPTAFDAPAVQRLAFDRLSRQWRYYVSDEGVVLEHSAGYHAEGLLLLRSALQLLQAARMEVPATWPVQVRAAEAFQALITRPDGTLPNFGDTRLPETARPLALTVPGVAPETSELALLPLSGYGVARTRDANGNVLAHAVLNWSNFPGQAHKQADEPGFTLWAAGRSWVTPTGYAPYGTVYRGPVEGWLGSNAPHGQDESAGAGRSSRLLGSAVLAQAVLLDVERTAPGGAGYRRQLVCLGSRVWLVIDQPLGATPWATTETLWTFAPDTAAQALAPSRWLIRSADGGAMVASLLADPARPAHAQPLKGSLAPFGGWVVTEGGVRSAPALRVIGDSKSWTAMAFELAGPSAPAQSAEPVRLHWSSGDHWESSGSGWRVRRDGADLQVWLEGQQGETVVASGPEVQLAQAKITQALRETVAAYPRHLDLDYFRLRAVPWLAAMWVGLIALRLTIRQVTVMRRWLPLFDMATLTFWALLAVWLLRNYFAG